MNLDALGAGSKARYRVTPRILSSPARADRLGFSKIRRLFGLAPTWDAPVTRVEADGGYYIQRNLVARVAVQYNERDGGRVRQRTYVSAQLAYWF